MKRLFIVKIAGENNGLTDNSDKYFRKNNPERLFGNTKAKRLTSAPYVE
jgi:hypothetical protein